jgi:hypothetical protein
MGFALPLLYVEPGHAGPCVPVLIPTEYEAGRYRVRIEGSSRPLVAEFRVVDPPVEKSRWERRVEHSLTPSVVG